MARPAWGSLEDKTMEEWTIYTEATGEMEDGLSNEEAAARLWELVQGQPASGLGAGDQAASQAAEGPATADPCHESKFLMGNDRGLYAVLYVTPGDPRVTMASESDGGDTWDEWGGRKIASQADALAALELAAELLATSEEEGGEGEEEGEGEGEQDGEGKDKAVGEANGEE